MHGLLVVSAAFSLFALVNSDSSSWSYYEPNGTSTWKNQFPTCGGRRQSPVNIVPKETVFDAGLKDLNLKYEPEVSAKLENNGHAVQITFLAGRSNISGGGLSSSYRAGQMHFHWGSTDNRGSEHQLQGKAFPMEIHIVHYNADRHGNLTTAMKKTDGLAVLGVMVEIQDSIHDNPAWNAIIDELNKTLYKGDSTILQAFRPLSFLPEVWTHYYTYEGSLTTPSCFESVHWIVFNKPVPISNLQIDRFRQLYIADRQSTKKIHLVDNFRPVQPLNGRQVTRSFQRPLFPCNKVSDVTMVCSALANDKVVFYNVTVHLCTLPVFVMLEVSQPDIGFDFVQTVYQDIKKPKQIGNLDYGFELEMHSHSREHEAGYLHITIKQVHPFSTTKPNPKEVISKDFSHNVCQLAKCSSHSCDKHWCDGTTIGYGNDTLNLGFSSTIDFSSGKLPMVAVDFYRIEAASQHLTAREKFTDGAKKQVLLTGTMVHADDTDLKGRNRRLVKYSQWKLVVFKALISESPDNIIFQVGTGTVAAAN